MERRDLLGSLGGWIAGLWAMVSGVALRADEPAEHYPEPDKPTLTRIVYDKQVNDSLDDWLKAEAVCSRHGEVWLIDLAGFASESRKFCGECYIDMVASHCAELGPEPPSHEMPTL